MQIPREGEPADVEDRLDRLEEAFGECPDAEDSVRALAARIVAGRANWVSFVRRRRDSFILKDPERLVLGVTADVVAEECDRFAARRSGFPCVCWLKGFLGLWG